ncbi:MAG: serine/threonine-protein kinase [Bacteroidota bacterium]
MDAARWTSIQTLFEAALDREPAEREPFLRRACRGDAALYREVASLLDVEVHTLFEGFAADAVDLPGLLSMEGEAVGPYRIAEEVGRGGMGAVYRAERADGAFEQTVALKIVKRGMDSEAILRRFEQERQILARLEHPHIARLLDGGVAGDGRPYFAMEFVRGEPVTAYCDARALGVEARLALFEQACAAVAFAHRSLVVHRDLKPSNILVAEDAGGVPQVKLLDFGIARLLDVEQDSDLTWTGLRPMTLEYAAPEQIRGEAVTTAADVYALGVLLYELLTGRRPHALGRNRTKQFERSILEEDPVAPSLAIAQTLPPEATKSGRAVTPEGVAHARSATPDRLRRRLAGDLDTVILKALEKDPERRYSSVEAFIEDVRRHRQGEPIRARRATVGYRVRKFASRHRTGVLTAAGVIVLLAAVVGVYTARLADARDRAEREAGKATEIAAFLTDLFEASDPLQTLGDTLSVRDLLASGVARIDALGGQPATQADLLGTLGEIYLNLGDPAQAEPLLRRAVALRRPAGDGGALALSLRRHGTALRRLDRTEEAQEVTEEALRLHEATLGRVHPETAKTLRDLGEVAQARGAYDDAETHLREALAVQRQVLPDSSEDLALTLGTLGELLERVGRLDEAEAFTVEALVIEQQVYGDDHPFVATTLVNLGVIRRERGDIEAAVSAYRQALAVTQRVYGSDHPETATVMRNLASALRDQEAYDEALALYERALTIRRDRLGPDHPRVANLLNSLARLHDARGDLGAAGAAQEEALAIYRRSDRPEPALLAPALHNLAELRETQGRDAEAEALYRESLATLRAALPAGSTDFGFPLTSLGTFLTQRAAHGEAVTLLREAVAVRRDGLPPGHRLTAQSERRLSDALAALERFDEAERVLTESLARLREAGAGGSLTAQANDRLAAVRAARQES